MNRLVLLLALLVSQSTMANIVVGTFGPPIDRVRETKTGTQGTFSLRSYVGLFYRYFGTFPYSFNFELDYVFPQTSYSGMQDPVSKNRKFIGQIDMDYFFNQDLVYGIAVPSTAAAYATVRGSDKSIRGMVLYKDSTTNFSRSYDTTSAILAHEMGHTLGLGHSRFTTALMDSSGGPLGLNKLTQDDRDGVTYLYPHKKSLGGCLGSMGTLKFVDDDDDLPPHDIDINSQGVLSFIIGVLLALGLYHKVTLGKKPRGNCIEI